MKAITYELEPDIQVTVQQDRDDKDYWVIWDVKAWGTPEYGDSLCEDNSFGSNDSAVKTFDTAEEAEVFWLTVRTTAVRR